MLQKKGEKMPMFDFFHVSGKVGQVHIFWRASTKFVRLLTSIFITRFNEYIECSQWLSQEK